MKELNPDLGIDIFEEYLLHSPTIMDINDDGSLNDNVKESCLNLLETIVESCPGLSQALLLMGKIKMKMGDLSGEFNKKKSYYFFKLFRYPTLYFTGATTALKKLLNSVDRTNVTGHLLLARIFVKQGHYESATQALETGLSYNFKVRNDPLYHIILGNVAKETGDLEGKMDSLQTNYIIIIN